MAKKKKGAQYKVINIKNKKATFSYEILDKCVAGMVLRGTEIKSIREGRVSLTESHCYFSNGELWVQNMHIAHYAFGNIHNHDEVRPRKLLLKRKELNKFMKTKEKGYAIIPLRLFISDRGFAKLEIALGRGKKLHDKRQTIKERDLKREMGRQLKV